MTPTERRALHSPAVVEAWEWLDTYCRHWATEGTDWQTTSNLTDALDETGRGTGGLGSTGK